MDNRERLRSQVTKPAEGDCWLWQGQVSNSGFGRIKLRDDSGQMSMQSAHRASYTSFVGALPADKKVIQSCGNRLCINPAHLVLEDL